MTSKRVTGVLKTPLDEGMVGAVIRLTSTITEGDTLSCLSSTINTDSNGEYDFNLVYGEHFIEVKYDDEYCLNGKIKMDASVTAPTTLTNLLVNHSI